MKGFGHLVNATVTLPRNDAGSNGNNTKNNSFSQNLDRESRILASQHGRCASPTVNKKRLQDTRKIPLPMWNRVYENREYVE